MKNVVYGTCLHPFSCPVVHPCWEKSPFRPCPSALMSSQHPTGHNPHSCFPNRAHWAGPLTRWNAQEPAWPGPFREKTNRLKQNTLECIGFNDLLDPTNGFTRSYSPEPMDLFVDTLNSARAIGKSSVCTLMDLSPALNSISHCILT